MLCRVFSSFFFEYWEQIKFNFDEKRRKNIWKNVCAFLRCGNPKFGYAEYICPDCFEKLVVPFTCKSKFCPSCGIYPKYHGIFTYFHKIQVFPFSLGGKFRFLLFFQLAPVVLQSLL